MIVEMVLMTQDILLPDEMVEIFEIVFSSTHYCRWLKKPDWSVKHCCSQPTC